MVCTMYSGFISVCLLVCLLFLMPFICLILWKHCEGDSALNIAVHMNAQWSVGLKPLSLMQRLFPDIFHLHEWTDWKLIVVIVDKMFTSLPLSSLVACFSDRKPELFVLLYVGHKIRHFYRWCSKSSLIWLVEWLKLQKKNLKKTSQASRSMTFLCRLHREVHFSISCPAWWLKVFLGILVFFVFSPHVSQLTS